MLEDDTAFDAAYRALTTLERSLTVRQRLYASVRQVFQRSIRVRFQKDQLLARQTVRVLLKARRFNLVGTAFLRAKHNNRSTGDILVKPVRWARAGF
jgi:hypothetical protein